MKRIFDIVVSVAALIAFAPVLLPVMLLVFLQDRHSPFYVAPRVGRDGRIFRMVKLRSMIAGADRTKVDSTSRRDPRITPVGAFVRRYKLDELMQFWNVVKGEMSIVGPRPNVERETRLYTAEERRLLTVKPGVTDIASIVFADEGEILEGRADPDLAYNQLIRPWKSRLGLLYVERQSLGLDLRLVWLTALALVSRQRALTGVQCLLPRLGADEAMRRVAARQEPLTPHPPPGAVEVVRSREVPAG